MATECDIERAMALARRALEASGVSPPIAQSVSHALIAAELDGIPSHGLSRIPYYTEQVASGKVEGAVEPRITRTGAVVRVDAATGFAFPAIDRGLGPLVESARESGIAALSISNSHHFGVAGHHVEAMARQGLVALGFGNSPAAIAPWGGRVPLFGTDPIAFAAPRVNEDPLVIDLSVSTVARGKIMMAQNRGDPIPDDWALDSSGRPTKDAAAAMAGSMRPIGDAKGASLALMVELLTAGLGDSAFGYEASSLFSAHGTPPRLGQLFLAMDPSFFAAGTAFSERMEALLSAMLAQDGVRLPGARRLAARAGRKATLMLDDGVYAELLRRADGESGQSHAHPVPK